MAMPEGKIAPLGEDAGKIVGGSEAFRFRSGLGIHPKGYRASLATAAHTNAGQARMMASEVTRPANPAFHLTDSAGLVAWACQIELMCLFVVARRFRLLRSISNLP